MLNLAWWEYDELLEHLRSRPDIWTAADPTTWLRTNREGDACVALRFKGPSNSGPYRQYQVQTIPMGWEAQRCEAYTLDLCIKWTAYGFRAAVTAFLITEEDVRMDPKLAAAVAVAIGKIGQDPSSDPESLDEPVQSELPDSHRGSFVPDPFEPNARVYTLVGGGYVALKRRSSMLRIDLSLRSPNGGYDGRGALTGFVRPQNGDISSTLEMLFPNPPKEGE